jgi:glycosyltransferase involved in cell wall biosynthesis
MAPRVSVVIKAYNHAPFVAQTIQSVLDQSFQDFEIVVTDDASTDGTADVVSTFADPRISLEVLPHNRGISGAMNATLARARGELIAILNSDDYALPGRLERQVAYLDAHPDVGAVFAMPRTVDESGAPTAAFSPFRAALALPDFSRRTLLRQFFFKGNLLCAPTAMVRRRLYAACGDYDPRLTNLNDLDMWVRFAAQAPLHVIDEELIGFRIRSNDQNMSAPRVDTDLRCQFEYARILKRFRAMPADVLEEAFAQDAAEHGIAGEASPDVRLALLALTVPLPPHRLFALETLFETAQSIEDTRRFRALSGATDLFNILEVTGREARLSELRAALARSDGALAQSNEALSQTRSTLAQTESARARTSETLAQTESALARTDEALTQTRSALAAQDSAMSTLNAEVAAGHARIGALERETADLTRALHRLTGSRSWRYTAPLRSLLEMLVRRG